MKYSTNSTYHKMRVELKRKYKILLKETKQLIYYEDHETGKAILILYTPFSLYIAQQESYNNDIKCLSYVKLVLDEAF